MQKFTKIVATIGPATETEETLEQLVKAGMNVARFNTKHGTPEWHLERMRRVRKVADKLQVAVGILLDLQGPEIRINLPESKEFALTEGETATFTCDTTRTGERLAYVPVNVVETLQVGHTVLLDDGSCEFEITEKHEKDFVAKALSNCVVKHRKTMNTPGITIDMPSLVDNDYVQLDGAANEDIIDFVGLSFVRSKADIDNLRQELKKRNIPAHIVAKIENQAALDNLDEIIEASDAVMVARGDLGVEVPFEQLAYWQKIIIAKCRFAAKPVITATQMLKSMVENPRPTRAEVTDISNAIFDNTSAVMLSEETTIGKYPVRAVATQTKIASFNEQYVESAVEDWIDESSPSSVTHAAVYMLEHASKDIDRIVCLTETGETVRLLSRFRPDVEVSAVTSVEKTYRQLALVFGVTSHLLDTHTGIFDAPKEIIPLFLQHGIVKAGERVLLVYGSVVSSQPGYTNSLAIVDVEKK